MISRIINNFKGLGKAIFVTDGSYELIVTLDVGPRILHFSLPDGDNILADNVSENCKLPDGSIWRIYGGHRIWHSPESFPRTYLCDSFPVQNYQVANDGISVWQQEEPWTHVIKGIEIKFDRLGVNVSNVIINKGAWPVEMAVWSITVMSVGGVAIFPVVSQDTGFLPNAYYVTWPYTKLNDRRVILGDLFILIKNDPCDNNEFKFGYSNLDGWVAYFNHGLSFVKWFKYHANEKYPDFGCNTECYNAEWGLEIEALSPLRIIDPESSIKLQELWEIKINPYPLPENDKDAAGVIRKLGILNKK